MQEGGLLPLSGCFLMPVADDAPNGYVYDAADQLRHDLKTPVTAISARTQLLVRDIRRSPYLPEEERTRLLARFAAIEAAVQTLCAAIDINGSSSPDRPTPPPEGER